MPSKNLENLFWGWFTTVSMVSDQIRGVLSADIGMTYRGMHLSGIPLGPRQAVEILITDSETTSREVLSVQVRVSGDLTYCWVK